jgi:hypothetical protein
VDITLMSQDYKGILWTIILDEMDTFLKGTNYQNWLKKK